MPVFTFLHVYNSSIIIRKNNDCTTNIFWAFFKIGLNYKFFGTPELKINVYYKMSVCLWQALDLEQPNHWTYVDQVCTNPIFQVNMYVLVCKKNYFWKVNPYLAKKLKTISLNLTYCRTIFYMLHSFLQKLTKKLTKTDQTI